MTWFGCRRTLPPTMLGAPALAMAAFSLSRTVLATEPRMASPKMRHAPIEFLPMCGRHSPQKQIWSSVPPGGWHMLLYLQPRNLRLGLLRQSSGTLKLRGKPRTLPGRLGKLLSPPVGANESMVRLLARPISEGT